MGFTPISCIKCRYQVFGSFPEQTAGNPARVIKEVPIGQLSPEAAHHCRHDDLDGLKVIPKEELDSIPTWCPIIGDA